MPERFPPSSPGAPGGDESERSRNGRVSQPGAVPESQAWELPPACPARALSGRLPQSPAFCLWQAAVQRSALRRLATDKRAGPGHWRAQGQTQAIVRVRLISLSQLTRKSSQAAPFEHAPLIHGRRTAEGDVPTMADA